MNGSKKRLERVAASWKGITMTFKSGLCAEVAERLKSSPKVVGKYQIDVVLWEINPLQKRSLVVDRMRWQKSVAGNEAWDVLTMYKFNERSMVA